MKELLRDIFPKIMEKMFFLVAEELEGGTSSQRGDYVAEIALRGPKAITIRILVPRSVGVTMFKNLFPEEDPEENKLKDMLRELANMVGGNLISLLGAEWQLGLPQVYGGLEALGFLLNKAPLLEYDVEGETISIYLES
jgi:hypothetical protein